MNMYQLESFEIAGVKTKNIGYEITGAYGYDEISVMIKSVSIHKESNNISTDMKLIRNAYIIGYDKDKNIVDKTSEDAVDYEVITK